MSDEAVTVAKAILAMDERLRRALAQVAKLEADIEQRKRYSLDASAERMKLVNRLNAVITLHWEVERVVCGDGCCHEGLGTCRYCGEPWPCKTYLAADEDPA